MENELKEKVEVAINNLKGRKSKIYFLTQDTKGNAKASIRYIYQMAKTLKDNGFSPVILHEKNDYTKVSSWLDEEYDEIEHQSIENQNLQVSPEDFLIIPEIFAFVMDQVKNLPCAKIVLAQSYAYILDTLNPGQSWNQFGFLKCITTNNKQKEYIEILMRQNTFDVITPYINDNFRPRKLPPMPIIGVHTRDQSDAIYIIKSFYLKFPQYRWFTFRDLRGLTEKEFANSIQECFLNVWVDDDSGFGTFPLESMASGVPVIGKIPNLQPDWMNEDNGIWIKDKLLIVDVIADFIQNWLEDNIKPEIFEAMKETSDKFKNKQKFENEVVTIFDSFLTQRSELLEQQISKTEQ
jgi:hypothetical protein